MDPRLRFYVHYEGEPEFTHIIKWEDPRGTFRLLKIKFAKTYNKKFGPKKTLNPNFMIVTNKKTNFEDNDIVSAKISPKSDVFVVESPEASMTPQQLAKLATEHKEAGNNFMNEKKYTNAIEKYTLALSLDPTCATLYANRAQAYIDIGKFKDALDDANKALLLDRNHYKAQFRKGLALFRLKQYTESQNSFHTATTLPDIDAKTKQMLNVWIQRCKEKIDEIKETPTQALLPEPGYSDEEIKLFLKKAHRVAIESEKKKNFRHAVAVYEQCLNLDPHDKISLYNLGNIWLNAKKYDQALQYFSVGAEMYPLDYLFHYRLGDVHMAKGLYEEASKYFNNALEKVTGDKEKENDLKVRFGEALYAAGAQGSAVKIFQDVIEVDENHSGALHAYGIALKEHTSPKDALPVFLKLLVKDSEDSKVREQLSSLMKDEEGYTALKEELSSIPQSASALAYLGMVVKDYGALDAAVSLYTEALAMVPNSASYTLNLVHVLEMLNRYDEGFNIIQKYCKSNPTFGLGQLSCAEIYNVIRGRDTILSAPNPDVPPLPVTPMEPLPLDVNYSPDQLDLLALFCTLVKIVYINGNLEMIPALSALIKPVREGRPMHTTTIRNEHAYYCCIDQLMDYHVLPLDRSKPLIYLSGDSHALTSAWQTIKFRGQPHLIKPLLVTGLKCWHLRPESNFYPKYNFWHIVPNAPRGADVIFQFGEIDCREGLIVATQKCIYADVAEGARVAVDIYINVLLEVKQKYGYNIYVHPPAPVIDITREIVKTFTQVLKQRVLETEGLEWLNFEDEMLSPDKMSLNPAFALDGTHLNPTYIYLVEKALSDITQKKQEII